MGNPASNARRAVDVAYLEAAWEGDRAAVEAALAQGANPAESDVWHCQAVFRVLSGQSPTIASAILNDAPLRPKATREEREDLVQWLLIQYPQAFDLAQPTSMRPRQTALHSAVRQGWPEMVALLLTHGAPVEALDEDGLTPLARELSVQGNWGTVNPSTIALLHEAGARWDAPTQYHATALEAYQAWNAEEAAPYAAAWSARQMRTTLEEAPSEVRSARPRL